MPTLFEPLTIRGLTLKNRIVFSPMCQASSVDGFATDWHLVHLGSRAVGGAGLLIMEAAAVSPEGRITPEDLGIWKDEHIDFLRRINDFIESQDCVPALQLAHAGRKASTSSADEGGALTEGGWQVVAPSALPFSDKYPQPVALDAAGIQKVIADFRSATERSLKAGFKLLEIHAAHGYLLQSFLSPLSNKRTDTYGGSFDNRIRLLVEVVAAVQEVLPDNVPLFVRISATDWTEGGWTPDDSVALSKVLRAQGVDLIDCSTGGNVPHADIPTGPNYQVEFSARIKHEAGIPTAAVGLITTAAQATELVATGQADLVMLAREEMRNPYFPLYAAQELGVEVKWPRQYILSKPKSVAMRLP